MNETDRFATKRTWRSFSNLQKGSGESPEKGWMNR